MSRMGGGVWEHIYPGLCVCVHVWVFWFFFKYRLTHQMSKFKWLDRLSLNVRDNKVYTDPGWSDSRCCLQGVVLIACLMDHPFTAHCSVTVQNVRLKFRRIFCTVTGKRWCWSFCSSGFELPARFRPYWKQVELKCWEFMRV